MFACSFVLYREVVMDLIEEYRAAERADYVTYGGSGGGSNGGAGKQGGVPSATDSPSA